MSNPNPAPPQAMYRTISFFDGDRTWGYPLPHLLGMGLKKHSSNDKFDEIALRFSTTDVLIVGTNLRCLWRSLLASEQEQTWSCKRYPSEGGVSEEVFEITNIHEGKLTPKWEMPVELRKNDNKKGPGDTPKP